MLYKNLACMGIRTKEQIDKFNNLTIEDKIEIINNAKQYQYIYRYFHGIKEISSHSIINGFNLINQNVNIGTDNNFIIDQEKQKNMFIMLMMSKLLENKYGTITEILQTITNNINKNDELLYIIIKYIESLSKKNAFQSFVKQAQDYGVMLNYDKQTI